MAVNAAAQLANDAFYLELPTGRPRASILHLDDGSSTVPARPARSPTPDCAT